MQGRASGVWHFASGVRRRVPNEKKAAQACDPKPLVAQWQRQAIGIHNTNINRRWSSCAQISEQSLTGSYISSWRPPRGEDIHKLPSQVHLVFAPLLAFFFLLMVPAYCACFFVPFACSRCFLRTGWQWHQQDIIATGFNFLSLLLAVCCSFFSGTHASRMHRPLRRKLCASAHSGPQNVVFCYRWIYLTPADRGSGCTNLPVTGKRTSTSSPPWG